MPVVSGAYSGVEDLLIGDIPLSARHGDGSQFIKNAAEEMDAQLGHIYVTPIVLPLDPKYRPTVLILKKINNFLASGRLLMDMAAAGEDYQTQAYARYLMKEATILLAAICDGKMVLNGIQLIDNQEVRSDMASITNEDQFSLVEGFYRRFARGENITDLAPYSETSTS